MRSLGRSELEEHGTTGLEREVRRALHRGLPLIGRSPRWYVDLGTTRRGGGTAALCTGHLDRNRCVDPSQEAGDQLVQETVLGFNLSHAVGALTGGLDRARRHEAPEPPRRPRLIDDDGGRRETRFDL